MNKLPRGLGFFIWMPPADPARAAATAKAAGVDHVLVKIADGTLRFPNWQADPWPVIIAAFEALGIECWGWQYVYGRNPSGEATIAVNRAIQLGVRGFVVNAEAEYKAHPDRHTRARAYMAGLRAGLGADFPIGLSSYRYPSYHPELPWREFLEPCNFNMPQVYWVWATNAGAQLRRSILEFDQMPVQRPIVPTGAAFAEWGWAAKPAEVLDFLKVAKELNLPGANFWEWNHTLSRLPACFDVIADFPWSPLPEPEPRPQPQPEVIMLEILVNLNLRTGRNTQPGGVIRTMQRGEKVRLLEVGPLENGYAWLRVETSRSEVGWCVTYLNSWQTPTVKVV